VPVSRIPESKVVVPARLYREAERDLRFPVEVSATIRNPASVPLDATVLDISASGLRASIAEELAVGEPITVGIAGIGMVAARIARRDGHIYGCAFAEPITAAQVAAASAAAETVLAGRFAQLPAGHAATEPPIERWPGAVRLAIIGGGSLALWGVILLGGRALLG
jgi:hypothetical protein